MEESMKVLVRQLENQALSQFGRNVKKKNIQIVWPSHKAKRINRRKTEA